MKLEQGFSAILMARSESAQGIIKIYFIIFLKKEYYAIEINKMCLTQANML